MIQRRKNGETLGLGCFPVSTTEVRQRNVGNSIPSKISIASGVAERKREPQQMVRNEDSGAESKLDAPMPTRPCPYPGTQTQDTTITHHPGESGPNTEYHLFQDAWLFPPRHLRNGDES